MATRQPRFRPTASPLRAVDLSGPRFEMEHRQPSHQCDIYARHSKLPDHFTRRRTKSCPFDANSLCELMVHTSQGLGSSGVTRALYHDWSIPPDKVGGIVGFRLLPVTKPKP